MAAIIIVVVGGCFFLLHYMLFPPTMIWQEFRTTPVEDLGFAGKNIPREKANAVYFYRVVLCDVYQFSPGEYLDKYADDVAIGNLVFTQDKDRVEKFLEEKGVKLKIETSRYVRKALVRR